MSMKNKYIKILDWAGNELLNVEYDDPRVDDVINDARCDCDYDPSCPICEDTGYKDTLTIFWEDEEDGIKDNVYEYINY